MGVVNQLKQLSPGLVEALGRLIIAGCPGDCIQLAERHARLEVGGGPWQQLELLVRGHHILVAIALTPFALVVDALRGEMARAVEVEIGRQDVGREGTHHVGESSGNMAVAKLLAHRRRILALRQRVVVGLAGAGLGLFDPELLQ